MEEVMSEEQPVLENENGSSLKKFKDVKSLESAYENLEKEFTRKSQLLSQMQKNDEENANNCGKTCEKIENLDENLKIWEKPDWQENVEKFLNSNPNASKYATEICKIVLKDKDVQSSAQPLLSAYAKFLESNFKTDDEIFLDEKNIGEIAKNQKVKDAVIKEYISGLKNRNYVPPVFLKSDGGGLEQTKPQPPRTLEQAKELVRKIFINKGE